LISYQLRIVIKKNKLDEFHESLLSMLDDFRKEEGCLGFNLYRDLEKENTYAVIAEWKTQLDMKKHFKRNNYSVLIGAAKVLGEDLEMIIGETLETGNTQMAREKIKLQPKKGK
jgi:quinol monooxygenase YgiN